MDLNCGSIFIGEGEGVVSIRKDKGQILILKRRTFAVNTYPIFFSLLILLYENVLLFFFSKILVSGGDGWKGNKLSD